MSADSLVSVLLPVHYPDNNWLSDCINSILSQSYPNIELIILIDESNEETIELINNIIETTSDVTIIQQSNRGFASATNRAFSESRGEYIAPIAQDDLWRRKKIESQMEATAEGYDLVFTLADLINGDGDFLGIHKQFPYENQFDQLFYQCYPTYESALINKQLIDDDFLLDCSYQIVCDWELWLRIWPDTKVTVLRDDLTRKREHADKLSRKKTVTMRKEGASLLNHYLEKYDVDTKFKKKVLSHFYQRCAPELYDKGETNLARQYWKKAIFLDPPRIKCIGGYCLSFMSYFSETDIL